MDIIDEHKIVKEKLIEILTKYPDSRNSDRYLTILYWRIADKAPFPYIPFNVIEALTKPETISRCRRSINAEGRLEATDPEVRRRRAQQAENMRRRVHEL